MHQGSSRWTLLGIVLLGIALFCALPYVAAAVVRGAILAQGAVERAAFAAGGSPWSWRFREPGDVVAGRAFGGGALTPGKAGLTLRAVDGSGMEIGLPLSRPADLTRLDVLTWHGEASTSGIYALSLRETLEGPLVQATLGTLSPDALGQPIHLAGLAWTDAAGRPAARPTRAAMLRLRVILPAGSTFTLDQAALVPAAGAVAPRALDLPTGLSAETLLAWRDTQRERDPLVTFGHAPVPHAGPAWAPWLPLVGYLLLLGARAWQVLRQGRDPSAARSPVRKGDLADAALVLIGPLWFIAGLGLSTHPSPEGVALLGAGVAYALLLGARRIVPRWHWLGAWRDAAWPMLAIPVALALVLTAGHAPTWPPISRVLLYLGWALFQQWLLLAIVGALLARALPRPWAVLLTALAFALLHTPNGLLMQLCFVAELGWAGWYFHRRALLPVALAHAASAVLLQAGLAGGLLRSLEVSARFLG
ncbi:CPBP family glutamic-type intramembrane protease [Luteibacter sp. NPDC031894]|uniref:CPBP family glutamic-type intramembrane protease n=1 Tax=Luteibacter sp. NPDC031894 TaxID=3390572 RepID=UPI003D043E8B